MWEYNHTNELFHAGVKGMKWGKRKTPTRSQLNKQNFKKAKNEAFSKYEKDLAKIEAPYKKGQTLSKKDLARYNALEKNYSSKMNSIKRSYKSEKKAIRGDINEATRRQFDSSSFGEKLLYSSGTNRRAGKLMVERGMSEIDAKSKAKKEAWRNTGLLLAGTIGILAVNAAKN